MDPGIRNEEGLTAEEKIREEGDFVVVADYLKECRVREGGAEGEEANGEAVAATAESRVEGHPPPLPKGMRVNLGTMEEGDVEEEVDEGFKRRIEELAAREDFAGEEGQAQLRELVKDAVRDVGASAGRNVRERTG